MITLNNVILAIVENSDSSKIQFVVLFAEIVIFEDKQESQAQLVGTKFPIANELWYIVRIDCY
jgi:hypothetical protein